MNALSPPPHDQTIAFYLFATLVIAAVARMTVSARNPSIRCCG
jgi:NADH:ubiquinone oxidoreductase subunit 6 (subunit J)